MAPVPQAEEAAGSPQTAASLRQRTFSMASFGSLDLRGSSSHAPSVASTVNDDPDAPPSSVVVLANHLPSFQFCCPEAERLPQPWRFASSCFLIMLQSAKVYIHGRG